MHAEYTLKRRKKEETIKKTLLDCTRMSEVDLMEMVRIKVNTAVWTNAKKGNLIEAYLEDIEIDVCILNELLSRSAEFWKQQEENKVKDVTEVTYQVAGAKDATSGVWYAISFATLLLFAATCYNDKIHFNLAIEHKPSGKFDDIVFIYWYEGEEDKKYHLKFQMKRKECNNIEVTTDTLFNETKNNPFNLYPLFHESRSEVQPNTILVLFTNAILQNIDHNVSLLPFTLQSYDFKCSTLVGDLLQKTRNNITNKYSNCCQEIDGFLQNFRLGFNQPGYARLLDIVKSEIQTHDIVSYDTILENLRVMLLNKLEHSEASYISRHDVLCILYKRQNIYNTISSVNQYCHVQQSHENTMQSVVAEKMHCPKIDLAVIGPSGTGKLDLITAHTTKPLNIANYQHILYFNAESEQMLQISICNLARKFVLDVDFSQREILQPKYLGIKKILENIFTFTNSGKCLLVFYNVGADLKATDDNTGIMKYVDIFRMSDNYFYIVASLEEVCEAKVEPIRLSNLSVEESVQHLQSNIVYPTNEHEMSNLAKILDNFPLALHMAIAYINLSKDDCTHLIFKLKESLKCPNNPTKAMLKIILEYIAKILGSEICYTIMDYIAMLCPYDIPVNLIGTLILDKEISLRALQYLSDLFVIKFDGRTYISVHPALQGIIQQDITGPLKISSTQKLMLTFNNDALVNTDPTNNSTSLKKVFSYHYLKHAFYVWKLIIQDCHMKFESTLLSNFLLFIALDLQFNYNFELLNFYIRTTFEYLKQYYQPKSDIMVTENYLFLCEMVNQTLDVNNDAGEIFSDLKTCSFLAVDSEVNKVTLEMLQIKYAYKTKNRSTVEQAIINVKDGLYISLNRMPKYLIAKYIELFAGMFLSCSKEIRSTLVSILETLDEKFEEISSLRKMFYLHLSQTGSNVEFKLLMSNSCITNSLEKSESCLQLLNLASLIEKTEKLRKDVQNALKLSLSKAKQKFGYFHPIINRITLQLVDLLANQNKFEESMTLLENNLGEIAKILDQNKHPHKNEHAIITLIKIEITKLKMLELPLHIRKYHEFIKNESHVQIIRNDIIQTIEESTGNRCPNKWAMMQNLLQCVEKRVKPQDLKQNEEALSQNQTIFSLKPSLNLDIPESAWIYFMDNRHNISDVEELPGLAIIINIKRFEAGYLRARHGSEIDVQSLIETFKYLHFHVEIHENCNSEEIKSVISKDFKLQAYRALVVYIMTHGDENGLMYVSDGKYIKTSDIVDGFSNDEECSQIPKIFFFEACRGVAKEKQVLLHQPFRSDKIEERPIGSQVYSFDSMNEDFNLLKLKPYKNVMIIFSTIQEFVSFRNSREGTWFTQAVCEELMNWKTGHYDLITAIIRSCNTVSRKASDKFLLNKPRKLNTVSKKEKGNIIHGIYADAGWNEPDGDNIGQTPQFISFLDKKFFYGPLENPQKLEQDNFPKFSCKFHVGVYNDGDQAWKARSFVDEINKIFGSTSKKCTVSDLTVQEFLKYSDRPDRERIASMPELRELRDCLLIALFDSFDALSLQKCKDKMFENFSASACPYFASKLKLFFFLDTNEIKTPSLVFQMSSESQPEDIQGERTEPQPVVVQHLNEAQIWLTSGETNKILCNEHADFLFVYGNTEEYLESLLIELRRCTVRSEDVTSLLTRVMNRTHQMNPEALCHFESTVTASYMMNQHTEMVPLTKEVLGSGQLSDPFGAGSSKDCGARVFNVSSRRQNYPDDDFDSD